MLRRLNLCLELDKRNIHSPDEVTRWLGIDLTASQTNPGQTTVTTRKKHPKSRFMCVRIPRVIAKFADYHLSNPDIYMPRTHVIN